MNEDFECLRCGYCCLMYAIAQIEAAKVMRYNAEEAVIESVKSNHWGPWKALEEFK